MAIVITNGQYYMRFAQSGTVKKTLNIKEARKFYNVNTASLKLQEKMNRSPTKCDGYYVFDTDGDEHALSTPKTVKERKHYSADVRKMIYNNANGKCELCGRSITYKSMTLDHVKPLGKGGVDEVENLACTCFSCNQFKGSILPDDFMERITTIFMYQMEKKCANQMVWKITQRLLKRII